MTSRLNALSGKVNKKRVTWCGPAAISIITGIGYDEAVDLIKQVTGHDRVMGVSHRWVIAALRRLGYHVQMVCWYGAIFGSRKPTLARWLREREDRTATYLVNTTRHFVVVRGNKIADNKTGEPVWTSRYPHRLARVKRAWRIERLDDRSAVELG